VRNGPFANRPLADLVETSSPCAEPSLLLRNLDEAAWMRRGTLTKTRSACAASRTSSPDMNCIIAEFWRRIFWPGASCLAEKRRIVVIRSAASCHPDRGKLSSRRIIVIPSGARDLGFACSILEVRVPDFPMPSRALTELLRGQGAHADPIACIEDLPADLATRQVAGFPTLHRSARLPHELLDGLRSASRAQ